MREIRIIPRPKLEKLTLAYATFFRKEIPSQKITPNQDVYKLIRILTRFLATKRKVSLHAPKYVERNFRKCRHSTKMEDKGVNFGEKVEKMAEPDRAHAHQGAKYPTGRSINSIDVERGFRSPQIQKSSAHKVPREIILSCNSSPFHFQYANMARTRGNERFHASFSPDTDTEDEQDQGNIFDDSSVEEVPSDLPPSSDESEPYIFEEIWSQWSDINWFCGGWKYFFLRSKKDFQKKKSASFGIIWCGEKQSVK